VKQHRIKVKVVKYILSAKDQYFCDDNRLVGLETAIN